VFTEAINALTLLGYTRGEASDAVKSADVSLSLEEVIAFALKKLNRI
jgi:Holliday junction resolvasome RuvABC DNA-binding subunit